MIYLLRTHCRDLRRCIEGRPKHRIPTDRLGQWVEVVDLTLAMVSKEGMVSQKNVLAMRSCLQNTMNQLLAHSPQAPRSTEISPTPSADASTAPPTPQPERDASIPSGAGPPPPAPPSLPQANEERVRIRWDASHPPYRTHTPEDIARDVQEVIDLGGIGVVLRAAQVHPSGDVDLYTVSPTDCERLVTASDAWLPRLPQGTKARIINNQFPVMVHAIPRNWFPPESLENGAAREEVLRDNRSLVPDAHVIYVGWAGDQRRARGKKAKPKGSLVIGFHRARDANALLRSQLVLRKQAFRTEIYDARARLVQCVQGQHFGHVRRGCTSPPPLPPLR